MIDPGSLISSVANASSVLGAVHSLLKGSRGTQRTLLLELEGNIRLLVLGKKGNIQARKLVKRLKTDAIHGAMESGFNFSAIKSGKLKVRTAGETPQMRRYVGWSTERLFANIYLKTQELQNIIELDPKGDHFRIAVRLKNIFRMMLLLVRHIRS